MKLIKVRVNGFQSIRDTNEFEINDITCLVGKNEAGKTAVLQALVKLNPVVPSEGNFDVTNDYPRSDVVDYQQDIKNNSREHANVITAIFRLEDEISQIENDLGISIITDNMLVLKKGYDNKIKISINVDNLKVRTTLINNADIPQKISSVLVKKKTFEEALNHLKSQSQTKETEELQTTFEKIVNQGLEHYIYTTYIEQSVPKFVYFNEYYQMNGVENIPALQERVAANKPKPSDHPMLGLIELARLDLDDLVQIKRTQDLVNQLEGAGNHLTKSVLKYWSQNKHISTRFDIRPGLTEDPEELRNGNNIYANIYDSRHMVSTSIGTRSRGFVWFFSFLAWYSKLKKDAKPLILLLDEPGLSLHAKAQEDLLCYFEKEVKGVHQTIYTTHSPFMVDSTHFERVRIVQDKGIDTLDPLPPEEEGTKVLTDVLEASSDSLFPLQGALGYEIYQTLFIGPNSLIVEGISDLLFLQGISLILEMKGRKGLNPNWVITPVGGANKVPTFVALIGAQRNMNLVTLIDIQKKDKQPIENLYRKKLLKKNHVITFADFIKTDEADIEDMFERSFLLKLINNEYESVLNKPIQEAKLEVGIQRINVCLKKYFTKNPMKNSIIFTHYRIARYFAENINELSNTISNITLDRFEEAFSRINTLLKN